MCTDDEEIKRKMSINDNAVAQFCGNNFVRIKFPSSAEQRNCDEFPTREIQFTSPSTCRVRSVNLLLTLHEQFRVRKTLRRFSIVLTYTWKQLQSRYRAHLFELCVRK